MNDLTHAEALRTRVVTLVLSGVLGLGAGLYVLIGLLLWKRDADAVPDALWLAAGTYGGAIVTWLNSSKGDNSPAGTPADPMTVQTAKEPLEVTQTPARDVTPQGPDWGVGADLPTVALDERGHADLLMLLVITAGVFLGGLILHLVLT